MARSVSKILLLSGVALMSLSACAGDRGPGEIGTKDDISVVNHGIKSAPVNQTAVQGADVLSAPATAQAGDFSATTEQAEAAPAPAVEKAEPVMTPEAAPESAPAVVPEMAQDPAMAASEPVAEAATSAPTPTAAPASSVYPAQDYAQAQAQKADMAQQLGTVSQSAPQPAAPVSAPAPRMVPIEPDRVTDIPYPLDKNAAYSPKAIEAARAQAAAQMQTPVAPQMAQAEPQTTPAQAPTSLKDPVVIQAVQKALAAKAGYTGSANGVMDTDLLNAIIRYQAVNNLPITGGLNMETLKALGVVQ